MIAGNTGGQAVSITDDSFYIKITEVSGSAHGWVRVERNRAHLWDETSERSSATNDPAFEVNGGGGTVGQVYKAWRNPTSGEILFFSRSGTVSACNCSLILLTDSGVTSGCNITYDANHYGLSAWGGSTPNQYAINNATLSYATANGSLTELKRWESSNTTAKPVAYSWELPYIPTASNPLTLRYDLKFKQDTALGIAPGTCQNVSTCKGNVSTSGFVYDPSQAVSHGFHAVGNITSATSGNIVLTSVPSPQVTLNANVILSGNISFSSNSHSMPVQYKCSVKNITGYGTDVENWFASEVDAVGTGGLYLVDTGFQNIGSTGYRGQKSFSITVKLAYKSTTNTVAEWPSASITYSPFHNELNYQGSAALYYGFSPIFITNLSQKVRTYPTTQNSFEDIVDTSTGAEFSMRVDGTC